LTKTKTGEQLTMKKRNFPEMAADLDLMHDKNRRIEKRGVSFLMIRRQTTSNIANAGYI